MTQYRPRVDQDQYQTLTLTKYKTHPVSVPLWFYTISCQGVDQDPYYIQSVPSYRPMLYKYPSNTTQDLRLSNVGGTGFPGLIIFFWGDTPT